jgi:hypothetical protein
METAWRWPAGITIIVAGGSTLWRAYLDEFRAGRRWNEREREHAEEMALITLDFDELEEDHGALLAENAALRSRNQWLEQRLNQPLKINGVPQVPEKPENIPSYMDAMALIKIRYGQGVPVTARHMMSMGWSQGGYTAALDLLRSAGVVEVNGTRTTWADYPSPEAALSALYDSSRVVLYGNTNTEGQGGE